MVIAPYPVNYRWMPLQQFVRSSKMKPQIVRDPFHNPFYNRFNDPVRQRVDDMQSHEYTMWLGERSRAMSLSLPAIPKTDSQSENHRTRALTSLVILVVVAFVISAAFLLK
jgi:hypothetical protein